MKLSVGKIQYSSTYIQQWKSFVRAPPQRLRAGFQKSLCPSQGSRVPLSSPQLPCNSKHGGQGFYNGSLIVYFRRK